MGTAERLSEMQTLDQREEILLVEAKRIQETEAKAKANSRSYRAISRFNHAVEWLTGTQEDNEKPKRVVGTIAVMGAGAVAGGTLGIFTGLGGGIFAGESLSPVSRLLHHIQRVDVGKYCEAEKPIPTKELIRFFAGFPDVITRDEIRDRLNGYFPKPGQKAANDLRYPVIEKLAREYREDPEGFVGFFRPGFIKEDLPDQKTNGSPKQKKRVSRLGPRKAKDRQKAEEILFVTKKIFVIQRAALKLREKRQRSSLRQETYTSYADVAVGFSVIGGAMGIVSFFGKDLPVGALGILDDTPPLAGPISMAIKEAGLRRQKKQTEINNRGCSDSQVIWTGSFDSRSNTEPSDPQKTTTNLRL